jgi:competence protein ComEC
VVTDTGVTSGGNQRVVLREENGLRVMAYIRTHLPWAEIGREITVTGELRPLARRTNPGGYDQFLHLRGQKIDGVIWADTVLLGETRFSPVVILRMARNRLAAVYDNTLPPREAAVMKSMVLGDRVDMDQNLAQQYRAMGIFHILSISGLHIAILMMAFNKLLGIFLAERKSGIIVLVIMVLYCLMTGASVATVRAVVMGGVLLFGKILSRKYDLLAAVTWACAALLIYEPLYFFDVGFQLSFTAVFGIATLSAPVERLLAKLRMPSLGKFRNALSVGIAAVVATYPLFAFHMYEIQLYSVLGNLIIAPTTTIILVIGIVIGILGLVWTGGATVLAGTVYFILRFYEIASEFFAALPRAMLLTGGGNLIITLLGAAVLFSFGYTFNGFGEVFRKRVGFLFLSTIILVAAVVIERNPTGLHITVLDTPGNYTVIRHRGDVLVIGAPHGGEDALLRYLNMRGVKHANAFIFTEPPQLQDAGRLARLTERFGTFYMRESAAGMTGVTGSPQNLVLLNDGDIRAFGKKTARISAPHSGKLGVRIAFGDVIININCETENANVQISDYIIKTAAEIYNVEEQGAYKIYSNGKIIRLRGM